MARTRVVYRLLPWLTAVVGILCPSPAMGAGESATLHVTLTPERLGRGTTLGFEVAVTARHGVPSGLTSFSVSYPASLGVGLSGLGFATCELPALMTFGPKACPNESVMGYGTATAEIPYGSELLSERMHVEIFRAPTQNGRLELLIQVTGSSPAIAQLTFPGELADAAPPFGGQVKATLPDVGWLPGAPNVAIVKFGAAIGPRHVLYRDRVHGRTVSFHPKGIPLPVRCPTGGFPFAARLSFVDGEQVGVRTTVACPVRPNLRRPKPRRRRAG